MLESAGVPAERHGDALVAIDKLDKIGRDGVAREFEQRGVAVDAGTLLLELFATIDEAATRAAADPAGFNADALARLGSLIRGHERGAAALAELGDIVRLCGATSAGPRLRLDPGLARGLSYYTGSIFEIAVPDLAGSLGGGGRYDELIGMFLGSQVPACGISLGLERILVVMGERNMFPPAVVSRPADVMVTIWNANRTADAIRLAGALRAQGVRVDVYPEADKIGKQFKYADSRGIRFVAVVGDDEAARGDVAIKDLKTGEQTSRPQADVADYIRTLLLIPDP